MIKKDLINRIILLVNERSEDGELSVSDAPERVVLNFQDNVTLIHLSVNQDQLFIEGIRNGDNRDVRFYDAEELSFKALKTTERYIRENIPVKKPRISIPEAETLLFKELDATSFGDAIYELAGELFQKCIIAVESKNTVTGEMDTDEAWYDEAQQDFYQKVYDKMLDFLQNGE